MTNPVVLITGGSRGIGAATARLFAQNGFDVCITYQTNNSAASKLEQELAEYGVRSLIVKADIASEADIVTAFDAVDKKLGKLTALVNNAGILMQQCRLESLTAQRIEHMFRTNVTGTFLCCQQAVKRMSTSAGGTGGWIVNVSSMAALSGSPNEYVDYAASKAAMDTLTRGLALEVATEGIRVNGVRPGPIFTDIHADGGEPERVHRIAKVIPMQRGGQAEEVAEAIFWLASGKSSYVSGTFINVAGGL